MVEALHPTVPVALVAFPLFLRCDAPRLTTSVPPRPQVETVNIDSVPAAVMQALHQVLFPPLSSLLLPLSLLFQFSRLLSLLSRRDCLAVLPALVFSRAVFERERRDLLHCPSC